MTLPGYSFSIQATNPAHSVPVGTSRWFVTGGTERGPITPTKVTSIAQFVAKFGVRLSTSILYDALDVFFREGGGEAVIGRVLGPTPVLATAPIYDQSGSTGADIALTATAKENGAWANGLRIAINQPVPGTGGAFTITTTHATDSTILEVSPSLADRAAAVTWAAQSSAYITLALGGVAENPRTQAGIALTLGNDDFANATDTQDAAARARFTTDLGGGQVSAPGRTTTAAHNDIVAHALAFNRTAILDAPDTATVATITATTANVRAQAGAKFAGVFGPWAVVPGILSGTRTVPYSAVQAGMIARSDGAGNAPNVAAAGDNGIAQYATGLSQAPWSDAERETLNDAGFNVARLVYGGVRTYGYRTAVDPTVLPQWVTLGGSREVSYFLSEAARIAEGFEFDQIDGRGRKIGEWGGALIALANTEYQRDALFGATPDAAFSVDVGPSVNTPDTIAAGKLLATVALKTSPMAERVQLALVKLLTTDTP